MKNRFLVAVILNLKDVVTDVMRYIMTVQKKVYQGEWVLLSTNMNLLKRFIQCKHTASLGYGTASEQN